LFVAKGNEKVEGEDPKGKQKERAVWKCRVHRAEVKSGPENYLIGSQH
jgi:hypothetical protein